MVAVKKLIFCLIVLLVIPIVYSTSNIQSHNASQIYPRNFTSGNYIFPDSLHIGGYDSNSLGTGDFYTFGHVFSNASVTSIARSYGIGLSVLNSGVQFNFTSLGGTATFDAENRIICDTTEPWVSGDYFKEGGHKNMFLTIVSSSPVNYRGATGHIKAVVNSSCIRISIAAAGLRSVSDTSSVNYYVYKHPLFAILDRGDMHAHVGSNRDASFHIYTPNGTGFYNVHIEDTAGADQHQALTIDQDGYNYDGIVGLNVHTYSSVPVNNKLGINTLLEMDGTGVSNSEGRFLDMRLIGAQTNSKTDGILMDPDIDHIIHVGSEDVLNAVYYYNTTDYLNITGNATSETYDYQIFDVDNSVLYIGNTVNFTTVSFSLNTTSSASIKQLVTDQIFYYCAINGTWMQLTGVASTLGGFVISGSITFTSPSDRGKCNKSMNGGPLSPTNYSYIAIERTRNLIVTSPIENLITISGGSEYFVLQKDMINLQEVSTPPETCDAGHEGSIYSDDDLNLPCFCNGINWLQMDDFSTVCS